MEHSPDQERTAVYRLFDANRILLYVGSSGDPGKRIANHANRQSWWRFVDRKATTITWYSSPQDARQAERDAIAGERPVYNVDGARWDRRVGTPRQYVEAMTKMISNDADLLCVDPDPALSDSLQGLFHALGVYFETLPDRKNRLAEQQYRMALEDLRLDQEGEEEHWRWQDAEEAYGEAGVHPGRQLIRDRLKEHDGQGYRSGTLHRWLGERDVSVARETVQRWLAADEKLGLVMRTGRPRCGWIWAGGAS